MADRTPRAPDGTPLRPPNPKERAVQHKLRLEGRLKYFRDGWRLLRRDRWEPCDPWGTLEHPSRRRPISEDERRAGVYSRALPAVPGDDEPQVQTRLRFEEEP